MLALVMVDRSSCADDRPQNSVEVKVKWTLVQALRLCTGRTADRGSRVIALLFLDHGIRRGWGVSVTPRPLFTPGEDPVPIVQEAGWAPGPVWTGAENLTPTGNRSPDRPTHNQSLYRLRYPTHQRIRICQILEHSATCISSVVTFDVSKYVVAGGGMLSWSR